jgi:hypothetical protein
MPNPPSTAESNNYDQKNNSAEVGNSISCCTVIIIIIIIIISLQHRDFNTRLTNNEGLIIMLIGELKMNGLLDPLRWDR